jgi:hypothetical protein
MEPIRAMFMRGLKFWESYAEERLPDVALTPARWQPRRQAAKSLDGLLCPGTLNRQTKATNLTAVKQRCKTALSWKYHEKARTKGELDD